MKIAIVQDELLRKGGAEQVALSFHYAFPEAPIYTLGYRPSETYPEFRTCDIRTSWLNPFAQTEIWRSFFYPLGVWAMETLDVTGYDVVLQSTTFCAKYVKISPQALVLTYCHTPFRLVFRTDSYDEVSTAAPLKRMAYNFVISRLRKIELRTAKRTDFFATNAHVVVPRIEAAYHPLNPVTVIPPSVKSENFYVSNVIEDYYLVVSRFMPYKRVDLVIEAFNKLPDRKLTIVGKGAEGEALRRIAGLNTTFLTDLNKAQLANVMARCKALIFPQLEDYGITALESAASGRPVIAYGEGGILDTMIPYQGDARKATAVFFYKQEVNELVEAIENFETLTFDPSFIRAHAEKFSEKIFVSQIQNFVLDRFASHFKQLGKE